MLRIVGRVLLTVKDDHLPKIEGRDACQAGGIYAELVRVRPPLVVRVDTALGTEVVLGRLGIEAVGRELVLALIDSERVRRRGHRDCTPHPTDRACAAPGGGKTFG